MPKTKIIDKKATSASTPPIEAVRELADALCRGADECYHQHERSARLARRSAPVSEERGVEKLCAVCDETLEQLADAYEKTAAQKHPEPSDYTWWHRANALWLASREYARRHRSCDARTRTLATRHSSSELETLHLEFELEASALLALKQACDDYARARPEAR